MSEVSVVDFYGSESYPWADVVQSIQSGELTALDVAQADVNCCAADGEILDLAAAASHIQKVVANW